MAFRDDFADLSAWNNMGGVSISPAGWAYHAGNGTATGYIYRAMGAGETYCECKTYVDQNSANWSMMKMNTGTGNAYNNNSGDGVGIYTSWGSSYVACYVPGTVTWTLGAPGWAGVTSPISPVPNSAANAIVLGIERISSTVYDFYMNGARLGRATTNTATSGTNYSLCGYNGVGAHWDYFSAGVRDIFSASVTASPMVLG